MPTTRNATPIETMNNNFRKLPLVVVLWDKKKKGAKIERYKIAVIENVKTKDVNNVVSARIFLFKVLNGNICFSANKTATKIIGYTKYCTKGTVSLNTELTLGISPYFIISVPGISGRKSIK